MIIRLIVSLITLFLPWAAKRLMLISLLKYEIHKNAYIGFSIIIPEHLIMDDGAKIGNFNVCKTIQKLHMMEHSIISSMNWITAGATQNSIGSFAHKKDRKAELILGMHASITLRHIVDCTDQVTIGKYTTIAGYHSQILTHSINLKESIQDCAPVTIGEYCLIGTNSVILPGSSLGNFSILGASSLLNKKFNDPYTLYGGVPANPLKKIPTDYAYFLRSVGYIQ
jgi:acetyltransferase-like isoleucine patch superfamily enzyme